MKKFIPYGRQVIDQSDVHAVSEVLQGDWLTTGPEVEKLERELADYCHAKYAVVCNSGTAALHMAYMAIGLGPSRHLITTPNTFLATANSAKLCGAQVEFADIDPETANLCPTSLDRLLKKKSTQIQFSALAPVHYAGHAADMETLAQIARSYNLKVIEDGCHALGARYTEKNGDQVRVGQCRHSDMTVFSFHPVKHITTGEGGAITTNDENLFRKLVLLRSHNLDRDSSRWTNREIGFESDGETCPWYYECSDAGYNYRIPDILCALGRSQLRKIDTFVSRRREIAALYDDSMISKKIDKHVQTPKTQPGSFHAYHLYPVRIDFKALKTTRSRVFNKLKELGIGVQVHYVPLYKQPLYSSTNETFPNCEKFYEQCLSLPIYPGMSNQDVEAVIIGLEQVLL